jgi:hypothetical protein
MADPKTPTSTGFSVAEIKELIAYAREQKVIALEAHGVRFQFNPAAHEPPPAPKPATKPDEQSPHGHFRPE